MNDRTIDFVKSLTPGPCSCEYNMGSCSIPYYDTVTGETSPGHYDRGPRTRHCIRCQAREALEADGIPYEKDDRPQWDWFMRMGGKIPIDTAPKTMGGEVWVGIVSGSILPHP